MKPPKLLHGPYNPPKTRRGRKLFCEQRGTVTVSGFSSAPIPWPYATTNGRPLILCGDLVRAVKHESNQAVAHHWGVCPGTVTKWRAALRVPEVNDGTRQLLRDIEAARTDNRLERARKASKTPSALAKASASLKGRVQPAKTIAAVRKAAKRPRSADWKAKMAAYWRRRGHPPGHPDAKFYTAREDALIGTASDAVVARKIGRSVSSVLQRRMRLGKAACRRGQ